MQSLSLQPDPSSQTLTPQLSSIPIPTPANLPAVAPLTAPLTAPPHALAAPLAPPVANHANSAATIPAPQAPSQASHAPSHAPPHAAPVVPETVMSVKKPKFKLHFSKFDINRFTCLPPRQETAAQNKQKYVSIPLRYNVGTEKEPILEELAIETPFLTSERGISDKQMPDGKITHSVGTKLSLSDKDEQFLTNIIFQIHYKCRLLLKYWATQSPTIPVGYRQFNPDLPGTMFSRLLYAALDDQGNPIPGTNSSIYPKLMGSDNSESHSLFTDLGKPPKEIPWIILRSSEIRYCPVLIFPNIYVGNSASVQMKLRSAIVTSVAAMNKESGQEDTIDEYLNQNPGANDALEAQIQALAAERQSNTPKMIPPVSNPVSTIMGSGSFQGTPGFHQGHNFQQGPNPHANAPGTPFNVPSLGMMPYGQGQTPSINDMLQGAHKF